jgi:acetylornithine/N-succinyldiaminopimelate aminotransferase
MIDASPLLDTYEQLPFPLVRGEGVYVYAEDGSKYLDLYGGHAVSLLGHCPKAIIDAIEKQSRTFFFYSNIARIPIREHAAEALKKIVWKRFHHFFFCNSGAEANENALKLSIRLTGRDKLISFKGAFHGRSLLCTAVTEGTKSHAELKGWCGDRVTFLTPNDYNDLEKITDAYAAVILEPIQSIGGVTSFENKFLEALRAQCTKVGAHLIFDEVQTGFGRTGLPFVSGYSGIEPDMFTTAKGIASGYPIGALFVHDHIASKVKMGDLGSTYGAAPVAMAAIEATVHELTSRHLFKHVQKLNECWQSLSSIPGVEEIRGRGCLIGIKTKIPAKELLKQFLSKGIITGTCKDPNVLRLLPPIILQKEHIEEFGLHLKSFLN